jgi:hypothetical protein
MRVLDWDFHVDKDASAAVVLGLERDHVFAAGRNVPADSLVVSRPPSLSHVVWLPDSCGLRAACVQRFN